MPLPLPSHLALRDLNIKITLWKVRRADSSSNFVSWESAPLVFKRSLVRFRRMSFKNEKKRGGEVETLLGPNLL